VDGYQFNKSLLFITISITDYSKELSITSTAVKLHYIRFSITITISNSNTNSITLTVSYSKCNTNSRLIVILLN